MFTFQSCCFVVPNGAKPTQSSKLSRDQHGDYPATGPDCAGQGAPIVGSRHGKEGMNATLES
jgi:hypothetical protein